MVYWVLSCEHGGNKIPQQYGALFSEAAALLDSHRGWDPGALPLFNKLKSLADASQSSTISRLLVELNRSLHHPKLFSNISGELSKEAKQEVLQYYYHPYRQQLEEIIRQFLQHKEARVYHISVHSFTPILEGEVRKADIGLLYDPARDLEKAFCKHWKQSLQNQLPEMQIRFNYPYLGTADGFTTYLRKQFPYSYAGIELEINQQWANNSRVYTGIYAALQEVQLLLKDQ